MPEAKELLVNEGCRVLQTYGDKSIMFSDPYGMNFHVWRNERWSPKFLNGWKKSKL